MKTLKKYLWLLIVALLPALISCGRQEIVFDYELEHFSLQEGKILLEVVVPTSTQPDDEIYVIGAFNGGMDAVGQDAYRLTVHPNTNAKWGVYLDANTNLSGGFWFYSKSQREERLLKGDSIVHTVQPAAGIINLYTVERWAAYFDSAQGGDDDEDIKHDGYVVYILNESSETDLALYAWGDAEAFGSWPGMAPTGTQKKGGKTYTYFDLGEANTGLNLHLIPNNNNGGVQWEGDALAVTIDHDIYIRIWDPAEAGDKTAFEVLENIEPEVEHDGYVVYLLNGSSETDFALYAWGDAEAFGSWPGMAPTGTQTIKGKEFIYFDLGEANTGLTLNLIPNNNGGGVQWEGADLGMTIDHDVYIYVKDPASAGDKTAYQLLSGPDDNPEDEGEGEEGEGEGEGEGEDE